MSYIFEESAFEDSKFNANVFVAKYQKVVSLENLKSELELYRNSLNSQLYEIINRNYKDFIAVTTSKLDGVDVRVSQHLSLPVTQFQSQVSGFYNMYLISAIKSMQKKIKEKGMLDARKQFVSSLQSAIQHLHAAKLFYSGNEQFPVPSNKNQHDDPKSSLLMHKLQANHKFHAVNRTRGSNEVNSGASWERCADSLFKANGAIKLCVLSLLAMQSLENNYNSAVNKYLQYKETMCMILSEIEHEEKRLFELITAKLSSILQSYYEGLQAGETVVLPRRTLAHSFRALSVLSDLQLVKPAVFNDIIQRSEVRVNDICRPAVPRIVGAVHCVRDFIDEFLLRNLITLPNVEGSRGKLAAGNTRQKYGGLPDVFNTVIQFVDRYLAPYLDILMEYGYSIVNDSCLPSDGFVYGVFQPVVSRIAGLYATKHAAMQSPDSQTDPVSEFYNIVIADVFHLCYSSVLKFLGSLDDCYRNLLENQYEAEVMRLNHHPFVVKELSKWSVHAMYYQLRSQEFATRADYAYKIVKHYGWSTGICSEVYSGQSATKRLGDAKTCIPLSISSQGISELTSGVIAEFKTVNNRDIKFDIFLFFAIELCSILQQQVYLDILTGEFLRLSVRLYNRLSIFVLESINFASSDVQKLSSSKYYELLQLMLPLNKQSGLTVEGLPSSVLENTTLSSDLILGGVDICCFVKYSLKTLKFKYIDRVKKSSMSSQSNLSDILSDISSCFDKQCVKIVQLIPLIWDKIALNLVVEIKSNIQSNIEGIPGRYRMMNRPVPTESSPGIKKIFDGLRTIRSTCGNDMKETIAKITEIKSEFVDTIVSDVCGSIVEILWNFDTAILKFSLEICLYYVSRVLKAVRDLDSMVQKRTAKSRVGGGQDDGNVPVSDADKIKLQMLLDVRTFVLEAKELLGGDVENFIKSSVVVSLFDEVREAERFL